MAQELPKTGARLIENTGVALLTYYSDVMMSPMASQIAGIPIVYQTVCSGADQRKYQSSESLAFVRGIHRWPMNSPHKGNAENVSIWWRHREILWLNLYGECISLIKWHLYITTKITKWHQLWWAMIIFTFVNYRKIHILSQLKPWYLYVHRQITVGGTQRLLFKFRKMNIKRL